MALRGDFFLQSTHYQTLKPRSYSYPWTSRPKSLIWCAKNDKKMRDKDLALDLAREIQRVNDVMTRKEDAIKKSKEILFTEMCRRLAIEQAELKNRWRKMSEEDKWVLIRTFVGDWEDSFKPLSESSVKEMIEEHLHEEKPSLTPASTLFPALKKIMGFSPE